MRAYLKSDRKLTTADVIEKWNRDTRDYTDMELEISSGGSSMGSGMMSSSTTEIDLRGADMQALKSAALQAQEAMEKVNGVIKVSSSAQDTSTAAVRQSKSSRFIVSLLNSPGPAGPAHMFPLLYRLLQKKARPSDPANKNLTSHQLEHMPPVDQRCFQIFDCIFVHYSQLPAASLDTSRPVCYHATDISCRRRNFLPSIH